MAAFRPGRPGPPSWRRLLRVWGPALAACLLITTVYALHASNRESAVAGGLWISIQIAAGLCAVWALARIGRGRRG